ncbi:MAG: hypothetical protein KDA98_12155 [Acidimicrobiales bacterium]|nr:hypothetical protein [Acidimicrobiales bacterium]
MRVDEVEQRVQRPPAPRVPIRADRAANDPELIEHLLVEVLDELGHPFDEHRLEPGGQGQPDREQRSVSDDLGPSPEALARPKPVLCSPLLRPRDDAGRVDDAQAAAKDRFLRDDGATATAHDRSTSSASRSSRRASTGSTAGTWTR